MATSGTFSTRWESSTWAGRAKYYNWSGSWSKSGTTITLSNMQIYMGMVDSAAGGTGSGTDTITVSPGGSAQTVTFTWSGGNTSNTQSLSNVSFSVGSSATSQVLQCYISGENTGATTIYFDAAATAPTGLAASNVVVSADSFSATVSVTGWGGAGDATSRYRELQCWTYDASSFVTPRRYQPIYGNSLSSTITVSNSSNGALTITPNTRYTLGIYASNGSVSTDSQRIGNYVTLASAPAVSLSSQTPISITIAYSAPSDGGYYTKNLQYSIDGGTVWITYATITGGTSETGAFTISNLEAGETYSILTRVKTTAGTTSGQTITITLGKGIAFYGPVSNQAKKATTMYGSLNNGAIPLSRFYASANGEARLVYQGFGHIDYGFGYVVYYTNSARTSTTIGIIASETELNSMGNNSSSYDMTIGGVPVSNTRVKEVVLSSKVTSLPNYFLQRCTYLDYMDISTTKITRIPNYFLYECANFNVAFEFPTSLTRIGYDFLRKCTSFNQNITLPSTLVAIGTSFLECVDNMTKTVNVGSLNSNIITASTYSFSATNSSKAAYTIGIKIAGSNRAAWLSKFPNSTSTPHRNLIDAGY